MDNLPHWLLYLQAFADIAWKAAAAALVALASPRIISSLKAYTEVRTAQLEAERDIERQRREAVEADLDRLQKVMPLALQGTDLLKGQLEQITASFNALQLAKGADPASLDSQLLSIISELMSTSISVEVARNNALAGQRMAKEIRAETEGPVSLDLSTPTGKVMIATAMLSIMPEIGIKDAPERLLKAIEGLAALARDGTDLPEVAGKSIAANSGLMESLKSMVALGTPMPVSTKYVLPYVTK